MSKRSDKQYLQDIIDSINQIIEYIEGLDYKDFIKDNKTFDAVVRRFEIIGEAANSVSDELKNKSIDVNWRNAVGMRNVLAHEYFAVAEEIIWDTAIEDLPKLKLQIEYVIKNYKE